MRRFVEGVDRLVVLSNKPAQVRKVIDITLPRPRNLHMLSAPEAYDIRREAMEILHEEVMMIFKAGGAKADFIEAYRRRGA
jgi:NitT/TauT family transport system ATP-binding protein